MRVQRLIAAATMTANAMNHGADPRPTGSREIWDHTIGSALDVGLVPFFFKEVVQ